MAAYNPHIHHRRSIRLKGYDYSQAGLYFITICMDRLKNPGMMPFGRVNNGKMILTDAGKMMNREWEKTPNRFPNTRLHEYIVMPNHFPAILEIVGATLVVAPNESEQHSESEQHPESGQPQGVAPTRGKTLGDMVGAFQSIVTVEYIRGVKYNGWQPFNGKLLQRNYYEHIIRNEKSYQNISKYIVNNPRRWDDDTFNPMNNQKEK